MRRGLLLQLVLLAALVSNATALEISGAGEGYFMSEAYNAAGIKAEAWAYTLNGNLQANPFAKADTYHAEASVQGSVTTDGGYAESGTSSTNDYHHSGIGAITNASIEGSGTIGMDYLGSVDLNRNYQNASADSSSVKAYVDTDLALVEGKASVDSMARDARGNYARVVATAQPSAWIGASQTVSIDSTSTTATMDVFGTYRDNPDMEDGQDVPPYVSAYAGSGNALGKTEVQYTVSKGQLYTDSIALDASNRYIVPERPSLSSMKAYACDQYSIVNPDGAGLINLAQDDLAIITARAFSEEKGSSRWTFRFVQGEGEITGTAVQDGKSRSALIY